LQDLREGAYVVNRVAVVGSRTGISQSDVRILVDRIRRHIPDPFIVSGGARGVDRWAIEYADALGIPSEVLAAEWSTGRLAGKERNWRLATSDLRHLFALWDGWSNGTSHAVTAAVHTGVQTAVLCPSRQPLWPL
jgi:SLOG family YspA-like protein